MKTLIIAPLIVFITTGTALATPQTPDRIDYREKTYALQTFPMEAYFEKHGDKKPKATTGSSGLWRGYVATFEVHSRRLLLKDIVTISRFRRIEGAYNKWENSFINDLRKEGEQFFVDFFSGILVLRYGQLVSYEHTPNGSIYQNYILLEVEKGTVKREIYLDWKQFKEFTSAQYDAFRKTQDYDKFLATRKLTRARVEKFSDPLLQEILPGYLYWEWATGFLGSDDRIRIVSNSTEKETQKSVQTTPSEESRSGTVFDEGGCSCEAVVGSDRKIISPLLQIVFSFFN